MNYLNKGETIFYEGDNPPAGFAETELTFLEWEDLGRQAYIDALDKRNGFEAAPVEAKQRTK